MIRPKNVRGAILDVDGGDLQHWNRNCLGVSFQALTDLKATEIGQLYIQDNQIGLLARKP